MWLTEKLLIIQILIEDIFQALFQHITIDIDGN